jgi:hypothetical protein
MDAARFDHLLAKAREAKLCGASAWRAQSTGEKVAVAFALNRADWPDNIGYTLAQAIERVDRNWLALIARVERTLANEG